MPWARSSGVGPARRAASRASGVTASGAVRALGPGRWTQARNLRLLAQLFADGRLRGQGLITHTISPSETLSIYEELSQKPADYLGVLIDWT